MFRHRGLNRTYLHNLQVASLLSGVAGMVNVSGFFAISRLTTHVTGHFAFFASAVAQENFPQAFAYLLFILAFFLGAFFSSFLSELVALKNERFITALPVLLEVVLLAAVGFSDQARALKNTEAVAFTLLFAMGLQNALVTRLSNSVVRTTHLTGLFTDLGIEVGQLFFFRQPDQQKKLQSSIRLRVTIIGFFFLGCVLGGLAFFWIGLKALALAAAALLAGLISDTVKYRVFLLKRKLRH